MRHTIRCTEIERPSPCGVGCIVQCCHEIFFTRPHVQGGERGGGRPTVPPTLSLAYSLTLSLCFRPVWYRLSHASRVYYPCTKTRTVHTYKLPPVFAGKTILFFCSIGPVPAKSFSLSRACPVYSTVRIRKADKKKRCGLGYDPGRETLQKRPKQPRKDDIPPKSKLNKKTHTHVRFFTRKCSAPCIHTMGFRIVVTAAALHHKRFAFCRDYY